MPKSKTSAFIFEIRTQGLRARRKWRKPRCRMKVFGRSYDFASFIRDSLNNAPWDFSIILSIVKDCDRCLILCSRPFVVGISIYQMKQCVWFKWLYWLEHLSRTECWMCSSLPYWIQRIQKYEHEPSFFSITKSTVHWWSYKGICLLFGIIFCISKRKLNSAKTEILPMYVEIFRLAIWKLIYTIKRWNLTIQIEYNYRKD